ncbi:hypothetical protein [Candidatus Uabimicrobium sp. HlEnr_7]|uniref:hypothetical protein n=1 Tax=Candidatus Uabimicrobium helgolandensis TaxID=3095367 RepID=UPI00355904F3
MSENENKNTDNDTQNEEVKFSLEVDHTEDATVKDTLKDIVKPKFSFEKSKGEKTEKAQSTNKEKPAKPPEKKKESSKSNKQGPEKEKRAIKIKKVNDLKEIIQSASEGNKSAIKKLIKPFLGSDEVLVTSGMSGQFGMFIKVYNFYFLTNQRVGDITITPFTGELNIEVAFLDDIKSYTIVQPYISLTFKMFTWSLYLILVGFLANSSLKRAYLKYKKSGLFIKFGDFGGTHIFFDRERFNALAHLSNSLNNARKKIKDF